MPPQPFIIKRLSWDWRCEQDLLRNRHSITPASAIWLEIHIRRERKAQTEIYGCINLYEVDGAQDKAVSQATYLCTILDYLKFLNTL